MKQFLKPLHLACSDDELRENLQVIKIVDGVASATNGNILVRIELSKTCDLFETDIQILNGKHIHKETWKEIFKCDQLTISEEGIEVFKKGIKKTLYYMDRQESLWDDMSIVDKIREAGIARKDFVQYNPKLIEILHKIFQHDGMMFSFSPETKGTIVFPYQDSGMMAVLMPMFGEDETRYIV